MSPIHIGAGKYRYEVMDNWAKRPKKWPFVEVADVAVDAKDNVYVFNRSDHPVMIFDKDGNYLDWWGGDQFPNAHGITIAPDGTVYCADTWDHTIKQFTPDGRLLLTLGTKHLNTGMNSGKPFNRPTHLAIASTGNLYISDGYGNSQVHVFAGDGKYLRSFGEPGSKRGQFNLPHHISIDKKDRVYVCDRSNNRVQVFDLDGKFIAEWGGLTQPNGLVMDAKGTVYICELEHRTGLWSQEGKMLFRWGEEKESQDAGWFIAPHGLAVDSRGVIYVGDVAEAYRGIDRGSRAVQKFVPAP